MPVIETATSGVEISPQRTSAPSALTSIIHDDVGGAASAVAHLRSPGAATDYCLRLAHRNLPRPRPRAIRWLSPRPLLAHGQTLDPRLVLDISEGYRRPCRHRAPPRAPGHRLRFRRRAGGRAMMLALGCMRQRPTAAWPRVPGDIAFVGFGGGLGCVCSSRLAAFDDHPLSLDGRRRSPTRS